MGHQSRWPPRLSPSPSPDTTAGANSAAKPYAGAATIDAHGDDCPEKQHSGQHHRGSSGPFTLTASPAPKSTIEVRVNVGDQGSYLSRPLPSNCPAVQPPLFVTICNVSIAANSSSGSLALPTLDDTRDEAHGSITVTVQSGTGYTVGSPSSASVTVEDDDELTAPTDRNGNGHIDDSDEVRVWWQPVAGAASYELSTAVEYCEKVGNLLVCTEKVGTELIRPKTTATTMQLATGKGDGQLQPFTVYRLKVRSIGSANDPGAWSEPAFIYPTNRPPLASDNPSTTLGTLIETLLPKLPGVGLPPPLPEVAGMPLYAHAKRYPEETVTGPLGPHELQYTICSDSIPKFSDPLGNHVPVIESRGIELAISKWETALEEPGVGPMVHTTRFPPEAAFSLPGEPGPCDPPPRAFGIHFGQAYNAVQFHDNRKMEELLCYAGEGNREHEPSACWRTRSQFSALFYMSAGVEPPLEPMIEGTLLVRDAPTWDGDEIDWRAGLDEGCSLIEHTIIHEIGHALGIGVPALGYYLESHPLHRERSIMSIDHVFSGPKYCAPQAYDVVAVMANHQSR